eukprot:15470369-Alexandrium_andersonii.AAC.1
MSIAPGRASPVSPAIFHARVAVARQMSRRAPEEQRGVREGAAGFRPLVGPIASPALASSHP